MVNGFTFALTIEPKYREINKTTMPKITFEIEGAKELEEMLKQAHELVAKLNSFKLRLKKVEGNQDSTAETISSSTEQQVSNETDKGFKGLDKTGD